MNRTLQLLLTIIMIFGCASLQASASDKGARISFDSQSHDFGVIHEDKGKVSCSFEFTNIGTEPLIIYSATASCGCTRPKYPSEPIAPGAKGKISVTYNPAHRSGEITSTVKVRTNDKKNKKIVLKLTGNVVK